MRCLIPQTAGEANGIAGRRAKPLNPHLLATDNDNSVSAANALDIGAPWRNADVAELVDARDLKSLDGNVVWVRVPPPAPAFARFASYGSASLKTPS